ncbi:hypothetical protein NDU88_002632 [Pleurodeles waltl]|uniref:Uncharacterized protein n=1 Tax=Pleurodeles waltl TaxID=8319 RepID=A0AAV7W4K5_PLEWA|nr:hypothetical protein NDU88_002632 [Pleurodeles waltl]
MALCSGLRVWKLCPRKSEASVAAYTRPRAPTQGLRKLDQERKYPGGTVDGIDSDPEEVGAVAKHIWDKDTEPRGVLKPERDERRGEWFSPGGEDVAMMESRMDARSGTPEEDDVEESR